jgi:hypothetical protein
MAMRKFVALICGIFNQRVMMPVMRWCIVGQPILEIGKPVAGEYVEGPANINVAVFLAAKADCLAASDHQSVLNACLESVRHEQLGGAMLQLYGALIGNGYPQEEAIYRVLANAVYLGMHLERRLAK